MRLFRPCLALAALAVLAACADSEPPEAVPTDDGGLVDVAAAAGGPGRVAKLGRVPDIRETQAYVASVVDCYLALSAGRGVRSARECQLSESAR